MSLVDFYTKILKEVDVGVTKDGFLQVVSNGEEKLLKRTKRNLEIALPKKELLDNMFVLNQNNKYIQNYLLFNPLCERSLDDSIGLDILKDFVLTRFNYTLLGLGTLLISLYDAPALQGDLPMDINLFLKDLKDTSIPGMKGSGKPVDKTTIDKWSKFVFSYLENLDKSLFNLVIPRTKKAAVKDSPTREARLTLTMLNELKEVAGTEETVEVNGVRLKPKEVKVFTDICNMFMDGCSAKGCITVATHDTEAPGFISLMTLYYKIMVRLKKLIKSMKEIDPALVDDILPKLDFDLNEIENAASYYKQELLMIPTENEINAGIDVVNGSSNVNTNIRNVHQGLQAAVQATQQPVVEETAPFTPDPPKTMMDAMLNRIERENKAALGFAVNQPYQVTNTGWNTIGTVTSVSAAPLTQQMTHPITQVETQQPVAMGGNPVRTISRFSPHLNSPESMQALQQETLTYSRPVAPTMGGYGYGGGQVISNAPMYSSAMMPNAGGYPVMGGGMMPVGQVPQYGMNGYPMMNNNGWPRR